MKLSSPLLITQLIFVLILAGCGGGGGDGGGGDADTTAPVTTVSPVGGTYTSNQSVTLTANEAATIYYTTDGSTPTATSTQYSTAIAVTGTAGQSDTTVIKYFATDTAGNSETVKTATFVIEIPTDTTAPVTTASPTAGTYTSNQSVELSANETATIYYTTDGSTPDATSTQYSTAIAVTGTAGQSDTTVIKYFASDTAGNSEAVKTATYIIEIPSTDTTAPVTTASPPAGTYTTNQSITLTANETATIYYTTDGSTPDTASTQYSAPISVTGVTGSSVITELKYFAVDTAGNEETVKTSAYTIEIVAAPRNDTVISGRVQLSGLLGRPVTDSGVMNRIAAKDLSFATVELYDAEQIEWYLPIAVTQTDSVGNYTLDQINSINPGSGHTIGDPIPAGTYTVIANKFDSNVASLVVAIQPFVKEFIGDVVDNDLTAVDSKEFPLIESMFGQVTQNDAGEFGGADFNIPSNAAIQVTFSVAMARGNLVNALSIKDASSVAVTGSWGISPDLRTATFYPESDASIVQGNIYTVTVVGGGGSGVATSIYGNPLGKTETGQFKATVTDTTPPNIQLDTPAVATDVPIKTKIIIRANELLDINTFHVTSAPSIGDKPTILYLGTGANSSYPYLYEIVPNDVLQLNTDYALNLSGAMDLAGNLLPATPINFKTQLEEDVTAPVTTASPASGTISSSQQVTLTTNESGATIYYILGDLQPQVYTAPISIAKSSSLAFYAVDLAGNTELEKSEEYTIIDDIPPVTSATPSGGNFTEKQWVVLTSNEEAVIYYTLDNSVPTSQSSVYSSAIELNSGPKILKFFGIDTAGNIEAVTTATYSITDVTAPVSTATPAGGIYSASQLVTLSCTEENSTCAMHYTLDGTDPTSGSTLYTSPISITGTAGSAVQTTLKFIGIDQDGNTELVNQESYTITIPSGGDITKPETSISPAAGTYGANQSVTLTANEAATIYYTTDGTTPTTSSTQYSGAISVTGTAGQSVTTVIKYFAVDTAGNEETVNSETFTIDIPAADTTAPVTTASLASGTYTSNQSVTLSTDETATIYYTTDGSTPTTGSTTYASAISVTGTAGSSIVTTLKYFAKDSAGNEETVKTVTYTIEIPSGGDITAPVTTATVDSTNPENQLVTLASNESAATINYILDDGSGGALTQVYTAPISITVSSTLSYWAVDTAGNIEVAQEKVFVITDETAPVTSASPVAGTYTSNQSVELSTNEAATIYYTTDGSTPDTTSTQYSTAIAVTGTAGQSNTTVIKYFAVDTASNEEAVTTLNYTIAIPENVPPITTASPVGGTYSSNQSVTLSVNETAIIYYTTNGTTPTTSSAQYTGAINMTGTPGSPVTTTLKYFAKDSAGNIETVSTQAYIIDIPENIAPTTAASPPGGNYTAAQSVTLTPDETATIYYTTNGTTPTTGSTVYTAPVDIPGGADGVEVTTSLKFFAVDSVGNTETVQTETYSITIPDTTKPITSASPNGGIYTANQSVTLTANETATIYYTTDGSTPTTGSSTFSGPISITGTEGSPVTKTLKYFAVDTAGNSEAVKTQIYTISIPDSTKPVTTATPAGATGLTANQSVTLSANETATIYYTTDGSPPTTSSSIYTGPISITGTEQVLVTTALKYFAVDVAGNEESVKTDTYAITLPDATAPVTTASVASGTYTTDQSVTLSANETATIYYTTNGDTPNTGSTQATGPIAISGTPGSSVITDLKYFAVDTAGNVEAVTTRTYTIEIPENTAPTTTASPVGGSYTASQSVTLTPDETATVYYTTNGSTPTTGSAVYAAPINIAGGAQGVTVTTNLKFFAVDLLGNSEAVQTEVYNVTIPDTTKPITSASPNGGIYTANQSVTLTANETATIYYTTDGSTPTTGSSTFSGPISITGTEGNSVTKTLKYFAVDTAGNSEAVKTQIYTISIPDTTKPVTTATPAGATGLTANQSVSLSANETATIYYTTDGSAPTTSSSIYSGTISIQGTEGTPVTTDLKYFAVDLAGNREAVKTDTYTITLPDTTPPVTTAAPVGGTYGTDQEVTLSCVDAVTTCSIYYTLDGSTPTTSSTLYNTPFAVGAPSGSPGDAKTLKYFATDGSNVETVQTQIYQVNISINPFNWGDNWGSGSWQ